MLIAIITGIVVVMVAVVFVILRRWKLKKANEVVSYQNEGRKSDKLGKVAPPKDSSVKELKDEELHKPNEESDSE